MKLYHISFAGCSLIVHLAAVLFRQVKYWIRLCISRYTILLLGLGLGPEKLDWDVSCSKYSICFCYVCCLIDYLSSLRGDIIM